MDSNKQNKLLKINSGLKLKIVIKFFRKYKKKKLKNF